MTPVRGAPQTGLRSPITTSAPGALVHNAMVQVVQLYGTMLAGDEAIIRDLEMQVAVLKDKLADAETSNNLARDAKVLELANIIKDGSAENRRLVERLNEAQAALAPYGTSNLVTKLDVVSFVQRVVKDRLPAGVMLDGIEVLEREPGTFQLAIKVGAEPL